MAFQEWIGTSLWTKQVLKWKLRANTRYTGRKPQRWVDIRRHESEDWYGRHKIAGKKRHASKSWSHQAPIVNTTQGLVSGLDSEDGYFMYLGIPFGVVESGNPFGPPLPYPAFEDTFNAIDDSAMCPQLSGNIAMGTLNCLHLSVFVPNISEEHLPVLVFIYGGAFEYGFYGRYLYGPKFLVRHNVIVVTLNYRLGPYGYMCTDNPRVPGNQASRDQLLALRWVNANIENFGGDPNKVTISGNSAGSMSSDMLIINEAPKVFQQVILQSGVSLFPSFPTIDRNTPLTLARHFGFEADNIDDALDFLASVPPSDILTAWRQLGLVFRPCIEREFEEVEPFLTENWVTKDVITSAKDLKIVIGFTENEALGLFLTPISDLTNIVNQSLTSSFDINHPDFVGLSEVRQFFFGDSVIDDSHFKNAIDLRSDVSFVYNSIRSIRRYLNSEVEKIYLYQFSYDGERNLAFVRGEVDTTLPGAAHADEVGYLYDISYFETPSVEDQLIIDRMTQMWTDFVKYGDPTPQPSTLIPLTWNPITANSPYHYINIDANMSSGTNIYNDRVAFWDVFYDLNGHLHRFVLDNQ